MKRSSDHGVQCFDADTVNELADLLECFDEPCVVNAPVLAQEMHRRGRPVATFEADSRLADLAGYRQWDLRRPVYLEREFDLVMCDAPAGISSQQLFYAMRILTHFVYTKPLLITYPTARRASLLHAFSAFGLEPAGYRPRYVVGEGSPREMELFANWDVPLDAP